MDWLSILFVILFVVLPLLQQILEERGRKRLPDEDEEAPELEPRARRPRPVVIPPGPPPEEPRAPAPARTDEWGAEWTEWTAPPEEELAGEEVVEEEAAVELRDWQEALPAEVVPEAVRVSAPVVSMEPLHVRRAPSTRPTPLHEPSRALRAGRPTPPRAARLLSGPGDLRTAVLASEILGPPRALRPL